MFGPSGFRDTCNASGGHAILELERSEQPEILILGGDHSERFCKGSSVPLKATAAIHRDSQWPKVYIVFATIGPYPQPALMKLCIRRPFSSRPI
jgi:hypothetical protein